MLDRKRVVQTIAAAATIATGTARADVSPHLSEQYLPSSNGQAAIAWDRTAGKLDQFLEHPYQAASSTETTRNFMFDSYPGIRVGGTGTWVSGLPTAVVEYVPGTGIIHVQRMIGTVKVDEYEFTPMGLAEHASVMLVEVTQTAGGATPPAIDAYSIFNYHLGAGAPNPGVENEFITYDSTRDTFYESGPAGVTFAYLNITPSTHHGCSPNNPYALLTSGANLMDDSGTGSPMSDAAEGFQTSLGSLATGASGWAGYVSVLAADSNGGGAADRVKTWLAGRAPAKVLADEIAGWHAWTTAPPAEASALEAALALQAQVAIRMGQVTEPGPQAGQILASVAPGAWNISWVRDMAYAVVGLVRAGHFAEAKAAIEFQMNGQVGGYQMYVGMPYLISVVRYYGNGTEWSDSNMDGPNVEFDGFGLFLWEVSEYLAATNDQVALATWWPVIKTKVAAPLVALQEASGLIAADSSIWEVHWNGQQRHFAYTSVTAANGLCAASRIATSASDPTDAATFLAAGKTARDAVLKFDRNPTGGLVQSVEALTAGKGMLDAATIEAINFGLIDPTKATASATIAEIENGLVPQSGRGFIRSDAGDDYSSHEWIFVDLRATLALALHGETDRAADLLAWNVSQASDNFGELSELHDPVTADYAGQSPMVGFGGGAYLLALYDRGKAVTPACGSFAAEADAPGDAGVGGGDGGTGTGPTSSKGGGCAVDGSGGAGNAAGMILVLSVLGWAIVRRSQA